MSRVVSGYQGREKKKERLESLLFPAEKKSRSEKRRERVEMDKLSQGRNERIWGKSRGAWTVVDVDANVDVDVDVTGRSR